MVAGVGTYPTYLTYLQDEISHPALAYCSTVVRVFTPRCVRDYEYFADTQTHTHTHTHTHNFTHSEQTEFVIEYFNGVEDFPISGIIACSGLRPAGCPLRPDRPAPCGLRWIKGFKVF